MVLILVNRARASKTNVSVGDFITESGIQYMNKSYGDRLTQA